KMPPIVIITGYDLPKKQIICAFTDFRGIVFGYFEKSSMEPKEFMQCIKDATSQSSYKGSNSKPTAARLFFSALLMITIVLSIFALLLWITGQIPDPQTQQTVLKTGGALIIVIAIFIAVFNNSEKIESIAEIVSKVWGK